MINTTAGTDACPRCGASMVSVRDATPWCAGCEWDLDAYDRARRPREFGWTWVDRSTWRLAYRMTGRQFDRLVGRPLDGARSGAARVVTAVASVLLLAGVLALATTGVWLIVAFPFPNLSVVLGVALLGLAYALRPRFDRLNEDLEVLSRDRAPELFALVDEVAAAIGAPTPQIVGVDGDINAYTHLVGVRRRRVLCLGLPLWGSLPAQERVALLGHELGHFVNGDPRRALLVQPAFTMLGSAADLVRPVRTVSGGGILELAGLALAHTVQWVLSRLLFTAHLVLVCVALRDSQRAEYLADELAARVAGSAAATRMLDSLLAEESIALAVRRESRAGHGPDRWRAAVAESRAAAAARLPLLRQLSVRDEASLFASHPPSGLRRRLLEARPWHDPRVVLTDDRMARIDAQLAREYERVRRTVSWSA
ncbi:Zn-dependent protease with chaperone function [Micromonospora rhizosphaerae]|uniref:Zn-dependent protease with chaperone function n=1 Tax=Micromonospora rhizosphaerae TaxID=568872 RepID=A0A1C6T881_9ACTN|nr:M48 family metallopeptidase [Micromonospora rhizosphaerae]SCL37984.1 Zn-dependent protease with chaperone function [Micromonospora rhizosphaerae]